MLAVDRISFAYGTRRVLKDVSLSCRPGQILGLVGPSGCGKTTLWRLVASLLRAESGSIRIDDEPPEVCVRRRRIGVVPQGATGLLPQLNLFQNTAIPVAVDMGRSTTRGLPFLRRLSVLRTMQKARIASATRLRPHECSGGMVARALLARALVLSPRLLVLDEAFSQLDELTAEELYKDLQAVVKVASMMCIIVSHSLTEVCTLCDVVVPLVPTGEQGVSTSGEPITIELPRPRVLQSLADPRFGQFRAQLRAQLQEAAK